MIVLIKYIEEQFTNRDATSGLGGLIGTVSGSAIGGSLGALTGVPFAVPTGAALGSLGGSFLGRKIGEKIGSDDPIDINKRHHRIGVLAKSQQEIPDTFVEKSIARKNPIKYIEKENAAEKLGYGKKRQLISKIPPISVLSYVPVVVGMTDPIKNSPDKMEK